MSSASRRLELSFAVLIVLAVVAWHAWWAVQGWGIPGLSGHEFRQTQTAVSIREMIKDGELRLDYATPILGKPWSLPMEFPTYQFVVATISRATGWALVPVARGVSLACFYLGVPALFLLVRRLGFSRVASALALVPVLSAPVYVFYSRTVMIEAMAWAASAWFLLGVLRYRKDRRPLSLTLALIAGLVAVLTKATTWAVFCAPWAALMVADVWRAARSRDTRGFGRVVDEVVLLVVPLLVVGLGWVWIADRIKEMNPIATFLTSANLRDFNFGTWAQRTGLTAWKDIWAHLQGAVMPGWAVAVSLVAVLGTTGRSRGVVLCVAAGALAGPLVLLNLYAIHDYYFYANAAFVCGLSGVAAATWWDRGGRVWGWRLLAVMLLAAIGYGEWTAYRGDFWKTQTSFNRGSSSFTRALHDLTGPDEVIVMHSPDWGAIIPYQIDRRMLIIPDSQMFYRPDAVRQAVTLLRDETVGLVVFRDQSMVHGDWLLARIRDFDLEPFPLFTIGEKLAVYANKRRYPEMQEKLRHGLYENLKIDDPALLGPIVALGTPEKLAGATNLDPLPYAGSLPFGASLRWNNGIQYFFAHSPTELRFHLPPGATTVELGYRMDDGAYAHADFDGVNVRLEVRAGEKLVRVVHEEFVAPDGARGPRHLVLPLSSGKGDTLILRVLPGPRGNNAFDWALLEYLRIR